MALKKQSLALKWLLTVLLISSTAMADKIVLRDGTIEESDRIWESENYIHFILKGTQSVEIRYAKTIVERIELKNPDQKIDLEQLEVQDRPYQVTEIKKTKDAIKLQSPEDVTPSKPKPFDQQIAQKNRAISFYDPRRSQRYWVSRKMKYTSLNAALDAMANMYDRSLQWVETHMGDENDLGIIHGNLIRQHKSEATTATDEKKPTSADSKQDTSDPATQDGPLHESLPIANGHTNVSPSVISKGIQFYDPRRSEKYWSSKKARHSTLKEAVNALAKHYGVSADWIEIHLGESNDLAIIHHNIQKNLEAD